MARPPERDAELARYHGASVVAIGAHPDDLEVGAGGTLARLARAGSRVVIAVLSVPNQPAVRVREAKNAAALLGCELRFVTSDCRHVEDLKTYEAVSALDKIVKEINPRLMISHSSCDYHHDHILAGQAALATQRLGHFDFWRFATSLRTPRAEPFLPSLYVNITETVDAKLRAIDAHESQFKKRGQDTSIFREMARVHGRSAGVEYAEAFEVSRLILN